MGALGPQVVVGFSPTPPRGKNFFGFVFSWMFAGVNASCHGELARLKPSLSSTPSLLITCSNFRLGSGDRRGVRLAPSICLCGGPALLELHLAMFAIAAVAASPGSPPRATGHEMFAKLHSLRRARHHRRCRFSSLPIPLERPYPATASRNCIDVSRIFYGVLIRRGSRNRAGGPYHFGLRHGGTTHGLHFTDPRGRRLPLVYYQNEENPGWSARFFPAGWRNRPQSAKRPAWWGLGLGDARRSLGHADGSAWRLAYEIDGGCRAHGPPAGTFTYLSDCPRAVQVCQWVMNARLVRLDARGRSAQFDVACARCVSAGDSVSPPSALLAKPFEVYSPANLSRNVV